MPYVEMPEPPGLYGGQLLDRATQYLDAFEALSQRDDLTFPTYFLCAHALELFLKAYLVASGIATKKQIRNTKEFGHKLVDMLDKCDAASLPSVPDLRPFTVNIFEMNNDFDFRYPSNYSLIVPGREECLRVLRSLREAIAPVINQKRLIADLQFAADTRHLRGEAIRWND
ncbi:hypothetical protein V1290_000218 [Bradyrhizobium sp. AZCC 1578]|uniref:hypothetical protein n=1 Tax=Bradyrhizobium sp. AZCC 1578 TaxID=3117027 RepID=UPI002FF1652D